MQIWLAIKDLEFTIEKCDDDKMTRKELVKELQVHVDVDELDEINVGRGNRAKAEMNRGLLSCDLEYIGTCLEQAGSNTALQIELNQKR